MIIEKIPHNGMIVISEIRDGYLVTMKYDGYTKREALQAFRAEYPEIKEEK